MLFRVNRRENGQAIEGGWRGSDRVWRKRGLKCMNLPGSEDFNSWHLKDRLPCKWKRVDVKPRDFELLRILLEQKFLSGDQIRRYFFEGTKRYGPVRVWKMRRFEFVERVRGFHPQGLFLPTQKAYGYFKSQFLEVPAPVAPDPRTLYHDLMVTDIRFLF